MKSPLSPSFLPAHSSLRSVGVDRFCLLLKGWGLKVLSLLVVVMVGGMSWGQTEVFSDQFSTSQGATYSTTAGAIGTSTTWFISRSGADWGAKIA